jgi:hypothetical protein
MWVMGFLPQGLRKSKKVLVDSMLLQAKNLMITFGNDDKVKFYVNKTLEYDPKNEEANDIKYLMQIEEGNENIF